jgi:dipeptidyl-peptidase-4
MPSITLRLPFARSAACTALVALSVAVPAQGRAQDRLKNMPGYERYTKMRRDMFTSVKRGQLAVTWKDEGKAFEYSKDGKRYRYDIATAKSTEIGVDNTPDNAFPGRRRRDPLAAGPSPFFQARGRQVTSAESPDKKWKVFYRDRNLWLSKPDGTEESSVTTDGSEKDRIKYGTASWVYGEELGQRTAMWWSPDSRKIAYYRFDESKVRDFYLQMKQLQLQSEMDIEAYPKAGAPNPIVTLNVYDLETKKSTSVDVRDGKPFDDTVVGHYVYDVMWSPDGKELLFNRTNRRQNVMEFAAADPDTGKCRVIDREEWPTSWVANKPPMRFLKDKNRFILTSERTGFKNFYLYDLSGKLLSTITTHPFEVENIVRVDEDKNLFYYMARSGDNYMKSQLHRVGFDGKGEKCLTDKSLNHAVDLAPDGQHFIDVAQTHDIPPVTRLVDSEGKVLNELAKSDLSKFDMLGLQKTEFFTYKSADGKTDLYGSLQKPSNFDPNKKYPMLVSVYGGPESASLREFFAVPSAITELGFLVASFDGRNVDGRGKKLLDSLYMKLGGPEIDDQAEGVKFLRQRPYVDGARVGIHGTSYGGFASALCILRYPEVFQAASASSAVTDWRHYDSIYTERYMWIPQENAAGYDAGSGMTYAKDLKGRLMLYYGTADNNVHPNNSMQLIGALQRAGKSFEVQVGPDQGHSGVNGDRMLEFFIENLVLAPTAQNNH